MTVDTSIQQRIDTSQNRFIELPSGEYEGPFVIKHPCNLIGNTTTLWAKEGPALLIESKETALKNLRIEVLEEGTGLVCKTGDTRFENVEVAGETAGIPSDAGFWNLPRVLDMGEFYAERNCSFVFEVIVPVETKIKCLVQGISFQPDTLSVGKNIVTVTTDKIKDGITVYGDILFCAAVNRRCYIGGCAKQNPVGYSDVKLLRTASPLLETEKSTSNPSIFEKGEVMWDKEAFVLQKGQRVACGTMQDSPIVIDIAFERRPQGMDIDPYVFLLDKNLKAGKDENIIFFGNTISKDGAVKTDGTKVYLDLQKVSTQTERISIAYSIYENENQWLFAAVKGFTVKVKNGTEDKMIFQPADLHVESTVTVIDFYRYKGVWKISAIGAGYKDGIRRLCESYGLEVL